MEFLVNIRFVWPADISEEVRKDLREKEIKMAGELARKGHLVRMWRVVGRRENWGLWRAKDATEMHAILSSLPIWPYMEIQTMALAVHPVDPSPPPAV
jgi:muconolactone D-isomerase